MPVVTECFDFLGNIEIGTLGLRPGDQGRIGVPVGREARPLDALRRIFLSSFSVLIFSVLFCSSVTVRYSAFQCVTFARLLIVLHFFTMTLYPLARIVLSLRLPFSPVCDGCVTHQTLCVTVRYNAFHCVTVVIERYGDDLGIEPLKAPARVGLTGVVKHGPPHRDNMAYGDFGLDGDQPPLRIERRAVIRPEPIHPHHPTRAAWLVTRRPRLSLTHGSGSNGDTSAARRLHTSHSRLVGPVDGNGLEHRRQGRSTPARVCKPKYRPR